MNITIPASIEDATAALAGVERLLTAKEWERAAIVAAFVEVTKQGKVSPDYLSPDAFAALGIAGLKSKNTVQRYVEVWQSTDRPRPTPGQRIDLDGLPQFPGTWGRTNVDHTKTQPGNVAAALSDPEFVTKVVARMGEEAVEAVDAEVTRVIIDNANRSREDEGRPTPGPRPVELNPFTEWLKVKAKIEGLLLRFPGSSDLRVDMANYMTMKALEINASMVDSDGRQVNA